MCRSIFAMHSNSTEREYLLKTRYLTWEYVDVFEDQFGSATLNDGCIKNSEDNSSFGDTGAKKKIKTSSLLNFVRNESLLETKTNTSINEVVFGGPLVYLKPSDVFSVCVVLSNAYIDEQNIDTDDRDGVYSPSLIPSQSVFNSKDRHKSSAPHHCSICHKPFVSKGALTIHLRSHTQKPFSCPQCEKTFSQKGDLKRHLLVHSGTKEYSCDTCYKAFALKGNLKEHLLVHSGTKDYSCDICCKTFSKKSNLKTHQLVHSGTKPYSCDICYKTFAHKQNLKTHLLVHSGTKPYSCDICYKSFALKGHLTTHRRVHTGEKPYECKECEAMFAQCAGLHQHMRTHKE